MGALLKKCDVYICESDLYGVTQHVLTDKPLKLDYVPIVDSCPRLGPQHHECKYAYNVGACYEGLCVMHCLNIVKQLASDIKSIHNWSPQNIRNLSDRSSKTISHDLIERTKSLMRLGGYRNQNLNTGSQLTRRLNNSKKRELFGTRFDVSGFEQESWLSRFSRTWLG